MIWKPAQLGNSGLPEEELKTDRKSCRRFGPCGVGKKALYLNSFYIDRRYYVPVSSVKRVFKRVAMSKGGFTGKGMFASISYLVVVYENGKEKQCNFKHEEQVDQMIRYIGSQWPEIKLVSEDAEVRLVQKEIQRAQKRLKTLSPEAQAAVTEIERAEAYLKQKAELSDELSASARKKRTFQQSKKSYRWVALAIVFFGAVSVIYGIYAFVQREGMAVYFTLFGLAAVFLFSGANVLPTAKNNRKAVEERAGRAVDALEQFLKGFQNFPVPACYAHPIVLRRMKRALEEGRARSIPEALEAVKDELKKLNSEVEVDQEEYDEIVAIKAMFLNEDYA